MVQLQRLFHRTKCIPSGYIQSEIGQGRQHSIVPLSVGTGAHNRPGTSTIHVNMRLAHKNQVTDSLVCLGSSRGPERVLCKHPAADATALRIS